MIFLVLSLPGLLLRFLSGLNPQLPDFLARFSRIS
jgi:hypothetical protein